MTATALFSAAGRAARAAGRPLLLGIDARCLLVQRTGVERFAYRVIDQLARLRDEVQCVLYVDRPVSGAPWDDWPHARVVVPPRAAVLRPLFDTWMVFQLPARLRRDGVDAFFAPYNRCPLTRVPRFGAVHGLEWWRAASGYRRRDRLKQWFWFQLSSRYSTGLVTFAHNTQADMHRLRPGLSVPVCVIPEGVDPIFVHLPARAWSAETLARLNVRRPYVLSVCSLDPRKNLERLLRAYARLVAEHQVREQLVLVGRAGLRSERLPALVRELGLTERVIFTGYLDDGDLVQLYNQAAVFVYPSQYEGFGLPVIEAMACGAPVVTSDGSALREVAGDAAILVNPHLEQSITDGLAHVLLDPDLRQRLIAAGLAHARQFDWLATARGIVEFIRAQIGWPPAPGGVCPASDAFNTQPAGARAC